MRRLLLIRHARTDAVRNAAFPLDEPLDSDGRGAAGDLAGLLARVGGWLDAQAQLDGRALAITHGGVVKAAVVHALGAPAAAFWRVDAAPLAATELHAHDGRWTLTRINAPLVIAKRVETAA